MIRISEVVVNQRGLKSIEVIITPTEMTVAQNMATLGNPERDQRRTTVVWNESQAALRASYGFPEIIDRVARY